MEDVTPVSEDREAPIPQDKAVSPWKTGVHQRSTEDTRPSQQEIGSEDRTQELRRSSRIQKPNPKYANVALVEEKEPTTFEEAVKKRRMSGGRRVPSIERK